MSRYIDADKLMSEFHRYAWDTEDLHIDLIEDIVNDEPTADVVEVVRCKDCRLYNTDNCYMIHGQRMNRDLFEDDYCSYGEREGT